MASFFLRGRLALVLAISLLSLVVHTLPLQAEESVSDNNAKQDEAVARDNGAPKGMEGIASYYAKSYHGKRTNSGARYNPQKLTAAHPTLPIGTKVKVVNLANSKEVIVTVNDRCRKRKTGFIDLSRAAAKKIGILGLGTARVRIVPLDEESS